MSAPSQDLEFDFWDFVACAVCRLSFSPPDRGPPPVPFWITECGHVLCNSHLNSNQSCAKCGEQAIQLVPLQRNIDPPMSDWFRFLPHAVDGIASAVKFQQESLAALVRHYRNQCQQLSLTCDRLRSERRSLRKDVEALQRELHLSRSRGFIADKTREPSAHLNHSGKRPMVETRGQNSSVKTNSSPRSVPAPVGPLRLTLPPGEHPTFNRQEQDHAADRPGSSRFVERYAYHGQDKPRVREPRPADEQQSTFLRPPRLPDVNNSSMAPPPQSSGAKRFKSANGQAQSHPDQVESIEMSTTCNLGQSRSTKTSENMGPPRTPHRPFSVALRMPTIQNIARQGSPALQTNRFIPSSSHGRTVSGPTVTPTVIAAMGNVGNVFGRHHMPFVPQSSNGFG